MRTLQEVERELAERKAELSTVTGQETEIYSRIVGYYRSLKNWNLGKREEFRYRTTYAVGAARPQTVEPSPQQSPGAVTQTSVEKTGVTGATRYHYFYRTTCPNCRAIKTVLDEMADEATTRVEFNVDEDNGFAQAREEVIMATPTVTFFDADGVEVFRTSDPIELKNHLETPVVA